MSHYLQHDEVVQALRDQCGASATAWANKAGVDRSAVSMVLGGKRPISSTLARAAGFAPVTLYVRLDNVPAPEVRALRPVEQAAARAETEKWKREADKARREAERLNAIIRRAAAMFEGEYWTGRKRKERP